MRNIAPFAAVLFLLGCSGGSEGDLESLGIMRKDRANPGVLLGEKNFAYLINNFPKGTSERVPWAGFWWPYTANGIASGANGGGISPAGKYDAARGGRTKAQEWEIKNHGSGVPKVQGWWGHCNGWTVAAALFEEPRVSKKVNGVEFSVADIKALLSEVGMTASYDFYGNRPELERGGRDYNAAMEDVVPDQFFLLLTNYVGKARMPMLFDRYTSDQVWNQPLAGYKFNYPKPEDYLGPLPDSPGIHRLNLTSTIWWVEDGVAPGVLSIPFNFEPAAPGAGYGDTRYDIYSARTLRMEIWLDGPVAFGDDGKIVSSGNVVVTRHPGNDKFVVGGAWKSGGGFADGHPDYMWVPFSVAQADANNPDGTANTEGNHFVELNWVRNHLLPGVDEPGVTPVPVRPAPSPRPIPSGIPSPGPIPAPTPTPTPTPTRAFT